MKNTFTYLLLCILTIGCVEKKTKPKNLISEEDMINILYDLNMLNAVKASNYQLFNSHNIKPEEFIYEKYKIDSLQFVQSHKYYISDIEQYEKMLDKIIHQLKSEKEEYSQWVLDNPDSRKDSLPPPARKIRIDSLIKKTDNNRLISAPLICL